MIDFTRSRQRIEASAEYEIMIDARSIPTDYDLDLTPAPPFIDQLRCAYSADVFGKLLHDTLLESV